MAASERGAGVAEGSITSKVGVATSTLICSVVSPPGGAGVPCVDSGSFVAGSLVGCCIVGAGVTDSSRGAGVPGSNLISVLLSVGARVGVRAADIAGKGSTGAPQ